MRLKKVLTVAALPVLVSGLLAWPTPGGRAAALSFKKVSAAELLYELAGRLNTVARRYEGRGQGREARIWRQWAQHYREGAAQLRNVPTTFFLRENIRWCRTNASQARKIGWTSLANLFAASARFWADIYDHLGDDVSDLEVTFPSEMLIVIPGAPGTPWEGMTYQQQSRPMSLPRLCDHAEYESCMSDARSMTSPTTGGLTVNGTMLLRQCQQWIAGCD
ncbi:MAG TPA: hypothetical protein VHU19_06615 [Pyrinomonadaceae bacterium]|jgi:hypothetical protein|nr:hypothetical protein [Pyrinomonadaceae bacterium]